MSTLLIRRGRPIGDPAAGILHDGAAGADRILQSLRDAGIALDDDRVRQLPLDPDGLLDGIDLDPADASFDQVVLGSHLVNVPDDAVRIDLLELARSHVAGGPVFVEHHPVDWLQTAADVPAPGGGSVGMVAVRVEPPFVSAVSILETRGRVVRQPFRARVLSEAELDEALARAGLRRERRLSPTWIEALR